MKTFRNHLRCTIRKGLVFASIAWFNRAAIYVNPMHLLVHAVIELLRELKVNVRAEGMCPVSHLLKLLHWQEHLLVAGRERRFCHEQHWEGQDEKFHDVSLARDIRRLVAMGSVHCCLAWLFYITEAVRGKLHVTLMWLKTCVWWDVIRHPPNEQA